MCYNSAFKTAMRTLIIVFCVVFGGAAFALPQSTDDTLTQLQLPDRHARMQAFYRLIQGGGFKSDREISALMNLLRLETDYERHAVVPDGGLGEGYGEYRADVIAAVTTLKDPRSAELLLNLIDTGDMVTQTLASFGPTVLSGVIGKLVDSDAATRNGALITLQEMLENSTVTDPESREKVWSALSRGAIDSDYYVSLSGLKGLLEFSGFAYPEVQIRVGVQVGDESSRNAVNPRSGGVTALAILGSPDFDVKTVDRLSARAGRDLAVPVSGTGEEDVNRDRVLDLVFHFRTQDLGIRCGDMTAMLVGKTIDGHIFAGATSISTVGCK